MPDPVVLPRRQSRDPLERLDTPAPVTRALLKHCPALRGLTVLEPCAGAFAIGDVLRHEGPCIVRGFDLEPRSDDVVRADTSRPSWWPDFGCVRFSPDAVVTNTPFSLAATYWRLAQGFPLVALLVRITWLEACADREDVRDPDALIVLPRVKFTGPGAVDGEGKAYGGGDSATVVWALWANDRTLLPARPIIRVNRQELKALWSPLA